MVCSSKAANVGRYFRIAHSKDCYHRKQSLAGPHKHSHEKLPLGVIDLPRQANMLAAHEAYIRPFETHFARGSKPLPGTGERQPVRRKLRKPDCRACQRRACIDDDAALSLEQRVARRKSAVSYAAVCNGMPCCQCLSGVVSERMRVTGPALHPIRFKIFSLQRRFHSFPAASGVESERQSVPGSEGT